MPRLRRRRDWDWTPSDEDFPEAFGHQADVTSASGGEDALSDANASERSPYEGYKQSASGQSWLSNEVIIGSLPDNKLKDALARYKSLVKLLEIELHRRSLTPRRRSGPLDYCLAPDNPVGHKTTNRNTRARKQSDLKLTPQQMLSALEMLAKLKKG